MIRFLTEQDVDASLDVATAIDLLEAAVRDLAAGTASNTPRQRPATTGVQMHLMGAGLAGRVGHKVILISRAGANSIVTLFGNDTKMLAMIQANRLGQLRTGAASGLMTRFLARPDATILTLFGTGRQARAQLEAVCCVRAIAQAYIVGRDRARTEQFCTEMSSKLKLPVTVADSAEAAVRKSHIVCTMTSSSQPVFQSEWLAPGTYVNAAGSNSPTSAEIDAATVHRASVVAIEDLAQAQIESGDLLTAIEAGVWSWSRATLISDIVSGRAPGRTNDDEITLFESLGIALWDIAAANYVYDTARVRGLGREIDLPL